MFEADGVVLESAVQIGLGRMACVAGFGEQAEISQSKLCHQLRICGLHSGAIGTLAGGIGEGQQKQRHDGGKEGESAVGFSR